MITVEQVLHLSAVPHENAPRSGPTRGARYTDVYLSEANQLLGTYRALRRYRDDHYEFYGANRSQKTWEAHHVLEDRSLDYLQIRSKFPDKEKGLCVLIPVAAHHRINSIFIEHTRQFSDVRHVLEGYRLAHSVLGNYSGARPGAVALELDKLLRAAFRCAGLVA